MDAITRFAKDFDITVEASQSIATAFANFDVDSDGQTIAGFEFYQQWVDIGYGDGFYEWFVVDAGSHCQSEFRFDYNIQHWVDEFQK